MSNRPAIYIDRLSKSFPGSTQPALNNINANMHSGQITGLVGPDGAGKTTLMRLICGLLAKHEGIIQVLGYDAQQYPEQIHEIVGYMPQKFGLYEDLTVLENLKLYANLRNVQGERRVAQFDKLLQFTALKAFQTRLAGQLSGGMKQKLGLACALLGDPKILLLDEPSVGVDPISRRELWAMVQQLLNQNLTVIWSTSYLDEAEQCDHVLLLSEGIQIFHGEPGDFLHKVHGRTFLIHGIPPETKRQTLMNILNNEEVIDGVIQGKDIRIVLAHRQQEPHLSELSDVKEPQLTPVSPRFEDAFIDALGGVGSGHSILAEHLLEKEPFDKPIIEARQLTKRFDDFTAVSNSNFSVRRGEIFGLLGPNGAGKSTTFKMMCGLIQPTEGQAFVMGLDLKIASSKARSKIGYMAQKFSLYNHLDALQNMRFFSGLYGLSATKQRKQINNMIEIFELQKHLKQNSGELPLGFKQRLALACAVMHEPDVLFLDEPTSGVDPITRREFWKHINGMVNKGVTVMVTTHFMDEAEYCDRIALIYRGQNIATDTPSQLKQKISEVKCPNPTLEEAFIELIKRYDLHDRDA